MILDQAIEELVSTYQSLDAVASRLVVDAKEVADALEKVTFGSVEHVALLALQKYNPFTTQKETIKPNADTEQQ